MPSSPAPRQSRARFLKSSLARAVGWGVACGIGLAPAAVFAEPVADPAKPLERAVEQHRAGKTQDALETLETLQDGPLAAHVRILRGRWLRELGELDAARAALRAALVTDPPREIAARAWHELAQLEIASDELGAARAAEQRAWELTSDSKLASRWAFELAELFQARGLNGEALALYRTVWERWPTALESESAFDRSLNIERETGVDRAEVDSLVAHVVALRRGGRCETVLEILPGIVAREDKSELQARALREERAACLFAARRYTEAARSYAALLPELEGEVAIEASIQGARAWGRAGKVDRAVQELTAISRKVREPFATRARYLVALLLEDRDPKAARRLLERVAEQNADDQLRRNAGWLLAWDALGRGQLQTARRRLEPLTPGPLTDVEVQRAKYWLAVAQEQSAPEEFRSGMLELADGVPLSYYGMLAAERLGMTPNLARTLIPESRVERTPSIEIQRARWLHLAGLPEMARDEMTSWRLDRPLDREERLLGATLLHELGLHFDASRVVIDGFGDVLERGIDPVWRAVWTAAWPRPYDELVRNAVREFDFDAELVYAIMREESQYRPEVQSPAGARGLMQLITPTARRIAESLGVAAFEPENLYQPEVNVRFGTYYLKKLSREFAGTRQLVIAAYNAGPEVVNVWQTRGGAEPLDRFVDSVPYNETRRYLRRVLRSYWVYELLYPAAEPTTEARIEP